MAQEHVQAAAGRDGEVEQPVAVHVGRSQVRRKRGLEIDGPALDQSVIPQLEPDEDLADWRGSTTSGRPLPSRSAMIAWSGSREALGPPAEPAVLATGTSTPPLRRYSVRTPSRDSAEVAAIAG